MTGDINGETESIVVAAEDEALSTDCFKNKIYERKN